MSIKLAASAAIVLMLSATTFAQPTYDVNFTSTPPTIDGIVSAGEWDTAEAAAGGWRILRNPAGPADTENNRFRMLWDATNLYIVYETDFDVYRDDNVRDEIRFGYNNINFFFDPDLDGEGNQGTETSPVLTPDGYQIAINMYLGSYACASGCSVEHNTNLKDALRFGPVGLSSFAGAYSDSTTGNNLCWEGMRGTQIGTVNGTSGGVLEIAIPWSDFDAPGLDANGLDPGLNLNGAIPVDGDRWNFNAGFISSGAGPLPVWSWHDNPAGQEFFASQPHGVLTFVAGGPECTSPNTLTVFRGISLAGGLAEVTGSDDSFATYNPGFTINNTEAPVWLIFDGVVAAMPTSTLDLSLESNAGTPGLTITLEAFNSNSGAYDIVDTQPASFNVDVVTTASLSSGIADYVTGSGAVNARIGWRQTGFTLNFPWEVRVDEVVWTSN